MAGLTYKDAGVDLDVYTESMSRLPKLMRRTFSPRVLRLDGGFAGLFQLDFNSRLFSRNYSQPVLVSGTDGVGTKLKVAQLTGCHSTVGIDLVAMCVNDVLCCGAEPLFFLDYVAMAKTIRRSSNRSSKGLVTAASMPIVPCWRERRRSCLISMPQVTMIWLVFVWA